MPEVNLNQQTASSKDELAQKVGLGQRAEPHKPLLMQVVEGFIAGEKSAPG